MVKGQGQLEGRVKGTNGGVPPAIHEIHARCLRQVKRHTPSLQTNEEYSDIDVIH